MTFFDVDGVQKYILSFFTTTDQKSDLADISAAINQRYPSERCSRPDCNSYCYTHSATKVEDNYRIIIRAMTQTNHGYFQLHYTTRDNDTIFFFQFAEILEGRGYPYILKGLLVSLLSRHIDNVCKILSIDVIIRKIVLRMLPTYYDSTRFYFDRAKLKSWEDDKHPSLAEFLHQYHEDYSLVLLIFQYFSRSMPSSFRVFALRKELLKYPKLCVVLSSRKLFDDLPKEFQQFVEVTFGEDELTVNVINRREFCRNYLYPFIIPDLAWLIAEYV
jgi:hypothetical protein